VIEDELIAVTEENCRRGPFHSTPWDDAFKARLRDMIDSRDAAGTCKRMSDAILDYEFQNMVCAS
jgi:hypothetical protein